MAQMKGVGYETPGPISAPNALVDITLPVPVPGPHELLVAVKAVSVNPVDTKVRKSRKGAEGAPVVLGWDAAGVVEAVGSEVKLFKVGDEVYYAGDITKPGTNSQYHLVDERIVGAKPKSLDFAEAAALPLVSLTAWEMLFDRMKIPLGQGSGQAILIMGGAGGVGSIAIQLARKLTRLTIIASASRKESSDYALSMGAHHIVDHTKPLAEQFKAQNLLAPTYIFSTSSTARDLAQFVEVAKPQGVIGAIDDDENLNVSPLKRKSLSFVWELMYTRSLYETDDILEQHRILNEVASLVDAGLVKTTMTQRVKGINAANLIQAHTAIESARTIGKIVLEGFD